MAHISTCPTNGWATALEVEYPTQLCTAWALCLRNAALEHGAHDLPTCLEQDVDSNLHLRARATLGVQPRGKKFRPLMPEYAAIIEISGPQHIVQALPQKTSQVHVLSPLCITDPVTKIIPPHSKCLRAPVLQGDTAGLPTDQQRWYIEYGVSWEPASFVQRAAGLSHPAHFLDGVHDTLSQMFDKMLQQPVHSMAMERTAAMRKWTQRFRELKESGVDGLDGSP